MKNVIYSYQSPCGRFVINEDKTNGLYNLFFRDDLELIAKDPNMLAFLVANFCLCNPNWDDFKDQIKDVPKTLTDWEKS
ncbi:hypothetical protein [Sporomusa acidovorans]|uniref:Uncharacterized protein n=1 Tax=Sporomusa acidovorans (strain ATCC 49682 / DSM 3132 / Mol) TaxID=1123286 RepID=A0ABZ3J4H6_SPOA4|nr:hypothetical protein [Sporomusa acidovorans]OZC20937.1 hypothetical protein SPACI_23010 [Sporomusa acidovorans DSM 3132]SDE61568.1 hypothetical protein SAMN04488499_101791 [Sporomusa acidovorans]